MTEKGDSAGKPGGIDIPALLVKIEQAERLLGEIRTDMRAVVADKAPAAGAGRASAQEVGSSAVAPQKIQPDSEVAIPEADVEPYRIPIQALFQLALSPPGDSDALEEALGKILHASAKSSPRAVKMMIRFPWARFMKSRTQYLKAPEDPSSFVVERTSPPALGDTLRAKVFVAVPGKHPSPVELARDEGDHCPWRIVSFSL